MWRIWIQCLYPSSQISNLTQYSYYELLHILPNMVCLFCWWHWEIWKHPSTPPLLANPSSSIQGWGLISWPLSPAAICSSSTETCYLTLCGRLVMELFIRQSLSCLLCAGFIIAPAMFGRQYLCLVSCAATCLLFQRRCAQALAIYHPLRGFLIKSPTSPSAPGRYRLQEMWKMSENLTAALCPLCHYPWAGYTL